MKNPIQSSKIKGIKIIYNDPLEMIEYFDDEKNIRNGFCVKIWKDGRKFKGYYLNNKINGWANLIRFDFDLKGDFCNDILNGYGEFVDKEENKIYKGYWINGKLEGIGIELGSDYEYYGCFINKIKNGYGKQIWSDNEVYEGLYKDDLFNGYGIYYFNENGKYYLGQWSNNEKNGYGELITNNKIYMGFYLKDKKNGFGLSFSKKRKKFFLGFWKNGYKSGPFKEISENSIKYGIFDKEKNMNIIKDENNEFFQILEKEGLIKYKKFFRLSYEYISTLINNNEFNEILHHQ